MIMSIKQQIININWIYLANFDPNLLKIDKKLYKNIDIYYIRQITMKDSDYLKIKSINSLCLIISEVDGHFEKEWK